MDPPAKITYILASPLTSLEQSLRAIGEAVSQATVLSKTQNKNKLIALCAFFFPFSFFHSSVDLSKLSSPNLFKIIQE